MSTQFHFAYSQSVKGNACIAGGPYYCAQNNEALALTQCMMADSAPFIDIDFLEWTVRNTADTGFIDPVIGLSNARVWLYSATNDSVIAPTVVKKNAELYKRFLINSTSIQTVFEHEGEHAVPTDNYGNACDYLGCPYMNNCGYNAAEAAFRFLYDTPLSRSTGVLYSVNQTAYSGGSYDPIWGLAQTGYLWIADGCLTRRCRLHIHFHGCLQNYETIGLDYIYGAGFSGWNDLVVFYPQAIENALNPNGCWDWWGYSGPAYASNLGVQTSIIWKIVQDLISTVNSTVQIRKML